MKVTLEMAGNIYEGTGKTVYEALEDLPINYTHVKAKGMITAFKGLKKAQRFLFLRPLRLAMANKTRKAGLAKQLESLLK